MPTPASSTAHVAIIGGGPAGLMAAEVLGEAGVRVDLYDAMPSVGRKFLLAGIGGMNITHAEPAADFVRRYGARADAMAPWLGSFGPDALRDWIHDLGIDTFIGTSGRVFPADMKAAPLLRVWLRRLRALGVTIHTRHRWTGWDDAGHLQLLAPQGELSLAPDATLLALGGGSWPRLGSDGRWQTLLAGRGIDTAPLLPANCGFEVAGWSALLRERFAGEPVKNISLQLDDGAARVGEFVVTAQGVEGSLIYAFSGALRDTIARHGSATLRLNLLPQHTPEKIMAALKRPRGSQSLGNHLRRQLGLSGVRAALLRELAPADSFTDPARLAALIQALPLTLVRARPLEEAISSAGGVPLEALDPHLMLRDLEGVFCAGEMLDWEAPTGGYLLTACFASGRLAGQGLLHYLRSRR